MVKNVSTLKYVCCLQRVAILLFSQRIISSLHESGGGNRHERNMRVYTTRGIKLTSCFTTRRDENQSRCAKLLSRVGEERNVAQSRDRGESNVAAVFAGLWANTPNLLNRCRKLSNTEIHRNALRFFFLLPRLSALELWRTLRSQRNIFFDKRNEWQMRDEYQLLGKRNEILRHTLYPRSSFYYTAHYQVENIHRFDGNI